MNGTCPNLSRKADACNIEISDHDVGAGIGEAADDRRTNALRTARDEGAAAVEPSESRVQEFGTD